MPSTYTLISSDVLSSSAASVTFSAIPSTYTDLVVRASIRSADASSTRGLFITYNLDSSALYSVIRLTGDGANAYSQIASAATSSRLGTANSDSSTANTFTSVEIYIPSYTASQSKAFSAFPAMEDNSTTAYISGSAGLYRSNTAISSLTLTMDGTPLIKTGSSFYLYGIKNS
jgi:hypothetical protein